MKWCLYLTKKYIKSYPKHCIGVVICISLFVTAFLSIAWYSDSYKYSLIENDRIQNGLYKSAVFYADKDEVELKNSELKKEKAGIVGGIMEVDNSKINDVWIGNVNEYISRLLSLQFISGNMPESKNEIAVEKSCYDLLIPDAGIGDTVTLNIKQADGTVKKQAFTLAGILKNYSGKMKSVYDYQFGDLSFPSILTTNNNAAPQYIHIFSENDSFLIRNITSEYKYVNGSKEEIASKSVSNQLIIIPIQIFFIFTTIIGVSAVSIFFIEKQEKNLNLLRCIGFSIKKAKKMLLIQGNILWFASIILSVICTLPILFLLKCISSFTNSPLLLDFNLRSLLIVSTLTLLVIMIAFFVHLKKMYRTVPFRQTWASDLKKRKSQTDLKKCWHTAQSRKFRIQNISCILLIMFCVGMSIFGSFLPLWNARGTTFNDPDGFPVDSGYSLSVPGGGGSGDSYYINFPVGCGVDHELADQISSDKRVRVIEASSHLCVPFFLSSKTPKNKFLYKYVVEVRKEERLNYLFKHSRTDEIINLAGGSTDNDVLVQAPVTWESYETLVYDGIENINENNFKNGTVAIGPEGLCSVGDEFTLAVPVPDKSATQENIEDHVQFKIIKIKVGATYPGSNLLISSEFLFSFYPDANYDLFTIQNLNHDDKAWTDTLEQKLETIEAASTGVKYYNFEGMKKGFYDRVNLETAQTVASVIIFIIIIIIAIIFLNYIQVKSNIKSYILMQSIGARLETIQQLIIREIKHTITSGIIFGSICGGAIVVLFSVITSNLKLWDIYLFYVFPVYLTTITVLYFGCKIAVKYASKTMINQNIIEMINALE